jgi:hypothetical protein
MGLPPPRLVGVRELRERFNRGDYLSRASIGEFTCCLRDEARATSADEPAGTRSLTIGYLDRDGRRAFMVHLYLRPNGTIGGSGRPDPKWLVEDGVVYRAP